MLILEDHPVSLAPVHLPPALTLTDARGFGAQYPGNFPVSADNDEILEEVCYWADIYANLTIPVLVSEWSLITGVHTEQWFQKLYEAQATAWAWSAGSIFCKLPCVQAVFVDEIL